MPESAKTISRSSTPNPGPSTGGFEYPSGSNDGFYGFGVDKKLPSQFPTLERHNAFSISKKSNNSEKQDVFKKSQESSLGGGKSGANTSEESKKKKKKTKSNINESVESFSHLDFHVNLAWLKIPSNLMPILNGLIQTNLHNSKMLNTTALMLSKSHDNTAIGVVSKDTTETIVHIFDNAKS